MEGLQKAALAVVKSLHMAGNELNSLFSGRDLAIELMKLAVITQEHVLLLGPPGTGKSELVARFASRIKARSFQYLLTRFTEPAELFGPLDLEAFHQGKYHIKTEGMLPRAEIAFLDEVFQASSAILNTLLGLVHERYFNNGAERQPVPLLTLFGASNNLPDDPTLSAFSDRFVLRYEIEPVHDDSLGDLFRKGWDLELERMSTANTAAPTILEPDQIRQLHRELARVNVNDVMVPYQDLMRRLRGAGVLLSERRMVKGLKLVRGAALLEGRTNAVPRDLWPLNHAWSTADDARALREIVQPIVEEAGGPALTGHPALADLQTGFKQLRGVALDKMGDGAYLAHLGALNQVRRQLLAHYADQTPLLKDVEAYIETVIQLMGRTHVQSQAG